LEVNLGVIRIDGSGDRIKFSLPLLNKGDYFFIKCLINGKLNPFDISFHTLAEDLPRSLFIDWLPPDATRKQKPEIDWEAVFAGLGVVIIAASFGYALYLLWASKPEIFPIPWNTFKGTFTNWCMVIIWSIGCIVLGFAGIALSFRVGMERFFKMPPKFPLPEELRSRGWMLGFPPMDIESNDISKASKDSQTIT
jgi:hypothetical protein